MFELFSKTENPFINHAKGFYILKDRGEGKTYLAIYEFLKDFENSILLTLNHQVRETTINYINEKYSLPYHLSKEKIFRHSFFINDDFRGKKFKRIIIDDADLIENSNFFKNLEYSSILNNVEEIIMFGTHSYNKEYMTFIKDFKVIQY